MGEAGVITSSPSATPPRRPASAPAKVEHTLAYAAQSRHDGLIVASAGRARDQSKRRISRTEDTTNRPRCRPGSDSRLPRFFGANQTQTDRNSADLGHGDATGGLLRNPWIVVTISVTTHLQRLSDGETRTRTGDTTIFRRAREPVRQSRFAGLLLVSGVDRGVIRLQGLCGGSGTGRTDGYQSSIKSKSPHLLGSHPAPS